MKSKIWIRHFMLMGMVFLFTNSCRKDSGSSNSSSGWSALGNKDMYAVYSLYADKNGILCAAGAFTNSSGNHYVAKWDGSKWSEVGTLNINDNIFAICGDSKGNLYIGGSFTDSNGAYYVAKWNGSSWTNISFAPGGGYILTLCTDASDNLFAASDFVAKWDGNTWTRLNMSGYDHFVNTILIDASNNLYVGGGAF